MSTRQVQPTNRDIKRRDYTHTTRLWGLCTQCRWTWQWNGKTEHVNSGIESICRSTCGCGWAEKRRRSA